MKNADRVFDSGPSEDLHWYMLYINIAQLIAAGSISLGSGESPMRARSFRVLHVVQEIRQD